MFNHFLIYSKRKQEEWRQKKQYDDLKNQIEERKQNRFRMEQSLKEEDERLRNKYIEDVKSAKESMLTL